MTEIVEIHPFDLYELLEKMSPQVLINPFKSESTGEKLIEINEVVYHQNVKAPRKGGPQSIE